MGNRPTTKRVLYSAAASLIVGAGVLSLLVGFSSNYAIRLVQSIAVAGAIVIIIGAVFVLIGSRMAGWQETGSEEEFEKVVQRTEELAKGDAPEPVSDDDFDEIVRDALDELPPKFQEALKTDPVVISDEGAQRRAYGLYHGDTIARDNYQHQIIIYRDTLLRDFGYDADLLRAQVTRTVRHELAHHLGWGEEGVRGLGL